MSASGIGCKRVASGNGSGDLIDSTAERRVRHRPLSSASNTNLGTRGADTSTAGANSTDYVTWTRLNASDAPTEVFAEANGYSLRWKLLEKDIEITQDAYDSHDSADVNSTIINVGHESLTDIFFNHFLPDLTGSAKIIDEYLARRECPMHTIAERHNVKFHNTTVSSTHSETETVEDPDHFVRLGFRLLLAAVSEPCTGVEALWKEPDGSSGTPPAGEDDNAAAAGTTTTNGQSDDNSGTTVASSTSPRVTLSRPPPDFGRFMTKAMFECFCAAVPYVWIPRTDWFRNGSAKAGVTLPDHAVTQFIRAMNARQAKLLTKVTCAVLGEAPTGSPLPVNLVDDGVPRLHVQHTHGTFPYTPMMQGPTIQTIMCCDTGVLLHADVAGRTYSDEGVTNAPAVPTTADETPPPQRNSGVTLTTGAYPAASASAGDSASARSVARARWWMPRPMPLSQRMPSSDGIPPLPSTAGPAQPPQMTLPMARLVQRVEASGVSAGGCVGGVAEPSGSVAACVELFQRFGVYSMFAVEGCTESSAKDHNDPSAFFPHAMLRSALLQRAAAAGTSVAGSWAVMVADPPTANRRLSSPSHTCYAVGAKYRLIALAYARGSNVQTDVEFYVSTCGKTNAARSRVVGRDGTVPLQQPALVDFLARRVRLVHDNSAQLRRHLCLERSWTSQRGNALFQVLLSVVGLSLANMYAVLLSFHHAEFADTSIRQLAAHAVGALPLRDRHDPAAESPDATGSGTLPTMPGSADDGTLVPLVRIRVDVKPLSPHMRAQGKTVGSQYQRSCWVCRMYNTKYRMTTWKCAHCNTPLCALDRSTEPSRRSRQSCIAEHSTSTDARVRCGGPGSHKGQVPRDLRPASDGTPFPAVVDSHPASGPHAHSVGTPPRPSARQAPSPMTSARGREGDRSASGASSQESDARRITMASSLAAAAALLRAEVHRLERRD
eukprot:m.543030 g.543030  ORF g.543030 m.543030 type:complete len:947 (-) comp22124_c0_seq2:84-2924(-)